MPDLHHALPALLQGYKDALRNEAERLAEDSAIVTLDLVDQRLDAEVMLDDKPVHVIWSMDSGQWESESDAEDPGLHDLASCIALIGLRRDIPVQSQQEPVVKETFQMMLERLLERQLRPEEEAYLSKIEKRFERVQKTKEIFDQDMVRLHPKWSIQGTDALELWSDTPTTAHEFWNYVALALSEKRLPFPSFLKPATDLDATRRRLQNWKQDKTLPQWVERIRKFSLQRAPASAYHRVDDIRLLITTSDAKLQGRDPDNRRWSSINAAHLGELRREHGRGALVLPAEAELLLVASLLQMQHSEIESFRLELERHASWLNSLFRQPALHSRLVTLDEVPFQTTQAPLRWAGEENASQGTYGLRLVLSDGSPAPEPLRVLPGAEVTYLSSEAIYAGPAWFGETTLVEHRIDVPLEALASSDGIDFIGKLDAPLPPSIASKIKREPLKVEISAECAKAPSSTGTNYAHMRVTAASSDGRYREVLRDNTWVTEHSNPHTDGTIVCYDRDGLDQVPAIVDSLRPTFDQEQNHFRVRMTRNFPDTFYAWAQQLPDEVEFKPDVHLGTILADPLIARVRIEATQTATIDWFDLRVVFDIEGVDLKPSEIRKLISANGGFVRLADGTWRRVQIQLSDEQQEMVAQFGIDLNDLNEEAHRVHWRHLTGDKAAALLGAHAWAQLQSRLAQVELSLRPEVPKDLSLTLRPYQVDGFHFLAYLAINRFGGILADDMGLGKTVQTITWVLWLRSQCTTSFIPPSVVVCPKSVLDVWAIEFKKAAPHIRVQVLHDKDELEVSQLHGAIDVLVMNYAQLRSTIEELKNITFLAAILDEGQQIKNPDSKAAKAARDLNAHNRLVLSGTPMENRLLDLWSLMSFATPGALGDRGYFTKHFDRRRDEMASKRLSARLRPFILRRTKGQVAKELPPRTEENMLCEMSGVQEQMYRDELANAQNMVITAVGKDALQRRRFALLQALTRLRQICCHPGLAKSEAMGEESAKLTAALELIEQLHEEGHKVLFFSQFVSMLKIVRTKLEEMNLPYHWLTGSSDNRADIVRNFQEDPNASVFLISLKAGGSGLNLTAASYVILYDPWWNPAVENQAIDRAHRIGQTQPVIAYRLVSRSSIEEKILTLQQQKQMLASDVLGEESFAQSLEREDFEFLLGIEANEDRKRAARKEA
ncbi:MAG: DEAD/DEAH box helicase [Verrucomicrobiaceae bacterium]|nr:DEAD/DEAH box helicase [Verrucomicrobiaceae bacterium]